MKVLKSDNGTEIKNINSRILLEELGIFYLRFVAYTLEQNGRIEREMHTCYNNGVKEIDGVKKARRVLEIKMLKTFYFMDGKLYFIHERIDEIEENQSKNIE